MCLGKKTTVLLAVLLAVSLECEASALAAPSPVARIQQNSRVLSGPRLRRVLGDDMPTDQMPSLFTSDEELYDRYAACLAATEGLRRIRDRDLAEELQKSQDEGDAETLDEFIAQQAKSRRRIAQAYIQNSGKVLRAMGMSVRQFNELGSQISSNDALKGKVSLFTEQDPILSLSTRERNSENTTLHIAQSAPVATPCR